MSDTEVKWEDDEVEEIRPVKGVNMPGKLSYPLPSSLLTSIAVLKVTAVHKASTTLHGAEVKLELVAQSKPALSPTPLQRQHPTSLLGNRAAHDIGCQLRQMEVVNFWLRLQVVLLI